jgi:hypothetical protein
MVHNITAYASVLRSYKLDNNLKEIYWKKS